MLFISTQFNFYFLLLFYRFTVNVFSFIDVIHNVSKNGYDYPEGALSRANQHKKASKQKHIQFSTFNFYVYSKKIIFQSWR